MENYGDTLGHPQVSAPAIQDITTLALGLYLDTERVVREFTDASPTPMDYSRAQETLAQAIALAETHPGIVSGVSEHIRKNYPEWNPAHTPFTPTPKTLEVPDILRSITNILEERLDFYRIKDVNAALTMAYAEKERLEEASIYQAIEDAIHDLYLSESASTVDDVSSVRDQIVNNVLSQFAPSSTPGITESTEVDTAPTTTEASETLKALPFAPEKIAVLTQHILDKSLKDMSLQHRILRAFGLLSADANKQYSTPNMAVAAGYAKRFASAAKNRAYATDETN